MSNPLKECPDQYYNTVNLFYTMIAGVRGMDKLDWYVIKLKVWNFKINKKKISSFDSKPINIRWIRTRSQPYWKIMSSIVL